MADPAAGAGDPPTSTVLDSLGEDMTRIVYPVSSCMLIVVLLVSLLSSPSSPSPLSASFAATTAAAGGDDIPTALITAVTFVVAVTAATFLLALLFYLRCTPCLRAYMGFSALAVLLLLGGQVALLLLSRLRFPLDAVSFALLLPNAAGALALAALAPASVPIALHQAALVAVAVLTAFWFTLLPEWTTWALLIAMAIYDLAAVLLPGGPLRVLLELAIERNEEIPALVYEARPVDPRQGRNWRLWKEGRQPGGDLDAGSTVEVLGEVLGRNLDANSGSSSTSRGHGAATFVGDANNSRPTATLVTALSSDSLVEQAEDVSALQEHRVAVAEMRVPLIQPLPERSGEEEENDGIGLGSSGAIKLGLGDFIFYSVLVGRAAMYDYMTVYACYLAIIAGLGVTLLLLAFFRRALPALPVSITLGVVFYVLTRTLLEAFVMQCSTNLLMF
ncbi:presenilin-like protein At2g29900 [Phragmites australis]|uniref:presenilin-like protein At2g29900 n=1 Tax=Phragmites australis TaxID=29695 RepID=UPI002D7954C9|nr:presenilin-like protein At2g29900 [Phragmites australis]